MKAQVLPFPLVPATWMMLRWSMSALFALGQSSSEVFEQDIPSGRYDEAILSYRLCLEFLSGRDFHPDLEHHRALGQCNLVLRLV